MAKSSKSEAAGAAEAVAESVTAANEKAKSWLGKALYRLVILVLLLGGLGSLAFWVYRGLFVKAVENYEVAFKYNWWTGIITKVDHPGWMTVYPFVVVGHTIDGRPRQVCMNANSRVLNCKLVRFNPEGLDKFIEWHGRSAGDDPENLYEILKSYAFDGSEDNTYPFLTIDRKLENKGPGASKT